MATWVWWGYTRGGRTVHVTAVKGNGIRWWRAAVWCGGGRRSGANVGISGGGGVGGGSEGECFAARHGSAGGKGAGAAALAVGQVEAGRCTRGSGMGRWCNIPPFRSFKIRNFF